ncbi:hypothetical protein [Sinorhizobium meliloti]|uniref:hypothetical protein n=1 Tax=Rhizobium meliloti TaxID=382 RepID=UPI00030DC7C1|nr:hypothetical protein [Sinorhizobium meliloti]
MFWLLDWAKIAAGAAMGAALIVAPAYFKGKAAGRGEAAVSALETSVKTLRKKGEINAQVSSSDAASLWAYYGLPDDEQAECMRRFAPLRPKLETIVYILQNDRPFANDVAAHNRLLSSLGCGK